MVDANSFFRFSILLLHISLALSLKEELLNLRERLWKCLSPSVYKHLVLDDEDFLRDHYRTLLENTIQFRGLPPHEVSDFKGPWIENHFIQRFAGKDFNEFGGFVPLFVQWTDYNIASKGWSPESETFKPLLDLLRDDVLYITISQANAGLSKLFTHFPNVIVISSGGEGHIPVPLIKGELPARPLSSSFPTIDIGFLGSVNHGKRAPLLQVIGASLKQNATIRHRMGPSPKWKDDMSETLFNLSPRGYGRASFRLSEIVQLGRIPVYVYDDKPWIPYEGTAASPEAFGYIVGKRPRPSSDGRSLSLYSLPQQLMSVPRAEWESKLRAVQDARLWYTYDGVMEQLERFFKDPLNDSASYIRCVPPTVELFSVLDHNL